MFADILPPELEVEAPQPPRRWGAVILVLLLLVVILTGGGLLVLARFGRIPTASPFFARTAPDVDQDAELLRHRAVQAKSSLERVRPKGAYIVIDSYRNRLRLYKDGDLLRNAVCSTGTGIVLKDPRNGREWVFDTPLGERAVERKVKNPVWAKPDWAFIEEGMVPPKDPNERFDGDSLGDYGLYIGDGYIIHGTLFKTLLGRRVTHGCIRLGDEDLEFVYRHAPIGSRVFLY